MDSLTKADEVQVLVENKSFVRVLVLNRPRQLNALSFQMVSQVLELFYDFESNSDVKLVIVKGSGRAFCAGGDVAAVVRYAREGNWKFGAKFFETEYQLNYLMATFSKPQVSILNGIVMGGGAGASIHGRFRIATDKTGELPPCVWLLTQLWQAISVRVFLMRHHITLFFISCVDAWRWILASG